jgi:hypothetical protein
MSYNMAIAPTVLGVLHCDLLKRITTLTLLKYGKIGTRIAGRRRLQCKTPPHQTHLTTTLPE